MALIYGTGVADSLVGTLGDDTLNGHEGDDTLDGGAGADSLYGGKGIDYVMGLADGANDTVDGGDQGAVASYSFASLDTGVIFTATGASGIQADGYGGTDQLVRVVGVDVSGSTGDDVFQGDSQANRLQGNGGNDVLTGGGGYDIFAYDLDGLSGQDTITDLQFGDALAFRRAGGSVTIDSITSGDDPSGLLAGQVMVGSTIAGMTRLYVGADAAAGADLVIDLARSVKAGEFFIVQSGSDARLSYQPGLVVNGSASADWLWAGQGPDTVSGLAGNDNLIGLGGNDSLMGGDGNDYLDGGAGADSLHGGNGDDSIEAGGGTAGGSGDDNDSVEGGDGWDVVSYNFGSATQPVHFTLAEGNVQIDPWGGVDTLNGVESIHLLGGSGHDILAGNTMPNWLQGGAGDDTLSGGGGTDTFDFDNASGTDLVTDLEPGDRLHFGNWSGMTAVLQTTLLRGDDPSALARGQVIIGTPSGGVTRVHVGRDANAGADLTIVLQGVFVAESFTVANDTRGANLNFVGGGTVGTSGPDLLLGTDGSEMLDGLAGNDTVRGSGGDDTLQGGLGDDVLEGAAGPDTLIGGGGNDTLDGGALVDRVNYSDLNTVSYSDSTAAVNVNLASGAASDGLGGTDVLRNIEAVRGSAFNDALTGSDAAFESFEGSEGADSIDGRGGTDRVDYSSDVAGVTVDLYGGWATDGYGFRDTLANIENVRGSAFNDSITGSAGANDLAGNGGNDTLNGDDGHDTLDGGMGADSLYGGKGNDHVRGLADGASDYVSDFQGTDIAAYSFGGSTGVIFSATGASGVQADGLGGNDTLVGIEQVHVFGTSGADTFTGDNQRNWLQGNGGNDTLTGGGNDDMFVNDEDTFAYEITDDVGIDTITDLGYGDDLSFYRAGGSFTIAEVLAGDDASVLTAGQVMVGGALEGITTLYVGTDGAAGADITIRVQGAVKAADFIVSHTGLGASLDFRPGRSVTGSAGGDVLHGGQGDDTLSGLEGDDALYGNEGNDTLQGGDGSDLLIGGAGNDLVAGGAGADILVAGGDGGSDTVDGGDGYDIAQYSYHSSFSPVVFTATESSTQIEPWGGADTLVGIEQIDLYGGKANDRLTGNSGCNFVAGDAGDDTLTGGGGEDIFGWDLGSGGNLGTDLVTDLQAGDRLSVLFGKALSPQLLATGSGGGLQKGQILFAPGSADITELLVGLDDVLGADLVVHLQGTFEAPQFVLEPGSASMSLRFVPGERFAGTDAGDSYSGTGGPDTASGAAGDDTLQGGDGNDSLDGGVGDDRLVGMAGDEALTGGAGNDTFFFEASGNGIDTISDLAPGDAIVVNALLATTTPVAGAGTTVTGKGIQVSSAGGVTTLWIDTNGVAGADVQIKLAGTINAANFIVKANGDGTTGITLSSGLVVNGTSSPDTLSGGDGNDTMNGFAGNDSLSGQAGNDSITGAFGNDTLDGGAGADTLVGGGNNDTYVVDDPADVVTELPGEGADTVVAAVNWTLGANLESLTLTGTVASGTGNELPNTITGNATKNTLLGMDGSDTLLGMDGNDTLNGGAGDDRLDGGIGTDSMLGGLGNDTFVVDSASDVIVEYASGGTDTVIATVAYTLSNPQIENLTLGGVDAISGTGNALSNTMTGNAAANQLSGAGGNDTLVGGGGTDTLVGGIGSDTFVVDDASDVVTELAGEGFDLIQASVSIAVLAANVESLTLTGTAVSGAGNELNNPLTGNALANVLDGGLGNDTLNGGTGADTLAGGLGSDTYIVDNAGDVVVELPGEGYDVVQASVSTTLGANVERLVLSGVAKIGVGNALNNMLQGNASDNTFNGGDGNDTIDGAAGNDTLLGGIGGDSLLGGDGSDRLDGQAGPDTMSGGAGDDVYGVDAIGDVIVELAGGGLDTVQSRQHITLSAEVENLQLLGTGNITGTGNALDNVITAAGGANVIKGLGGNDQIAGGAGNDTLEGGDGLDTLDGGAGNDRLVGGAGADTFQFAAGSGVDGIADFSVVAGDVIRLASGLNGSAITTAAAALAAATTVGADTMIDLGGGNSLKLVGVAADLLTEACFSVF